MGKRGTSHQPGPNERRTWHVHDDGSWAWEVVCDACRAKPKEFGGGKVVHWNIRHLKRQNEEGWSPIFESQRIERAAKAEGRDIERAR